MASQFIIMIKPHKEMMIRLINQSSRVKQRRVGNFVFLPLHSTLPQSRQGFLHRETICLPGQEALPHFPQVRGFRGFLMGWRSKYESATRLRANASLCVQFAFIEESRCAVVVMAGAADMAWANNGPLDAEEVVGTGGVIVRGTGG